MNVVRGSAENYINAFVGADFLKGTAAEENTYPIRRLVGMVLQNPDNQLVSTIVEEDVAFGPENLGLPPAEIRTRVDEALAAIEQYENDRTILGYQAIVDWDRVRRESVTALIEVSVAPQSFEGFDRIAERICQYDEVRSVEWWAEAFCHTRRGATLYRLRDDIAFRDDAD